MIRIAGGYNLRMVAGCIVILCRRGVHVLLLLLLLHNQLLLLLLVCFCKHIIFT